MKLIQNKKAFVALVLGFFLQSPLYGSESWQFLSSIRYATDRLFPLVKAAPSIEVSGDSCLVTVNANAVGPLLECLQGAETRIESASLGDLDGYLKGISLDTILFSPCLMHGNQEHSFFLQFRYSNQEGYRLPQTRTIIFDEYLANRLQTAWCDAIISGKKGVKVTLLPGLTISSADVGSGVRERGRNKEGSVSAERIAEQIVARSTPDSPRQDGREAGNRVFELTEIEAAAGTPGSSFRNGHKSGNRAIGLTEKEATSISSQPRSFHGNQQEQISTAEPPPKEFPVMPDFVINPNQDADKSEGLGEGYGPSIRRPLEGPHNHLLQ